MLAAVTAERQLVSKLLEDSTLTSVGLANLRREAELTGIPLAEVLLDHELISEADVGQIYAEMSGAATSSGYARASIIRPSIRRRTRKRSSSGSR